MDTNGNVQSSHASQFPAREIVLFGINAAAFGATLVLLALGNSKGPVVLLTIGTGLYTVAGLARAYSLWLSKRVPSTKSR